MIVYHVGIENSKLLNERILTRVKFGGHNVPQEKVNERNKRNGALIRKAVLKADSALIF